MTAQMRRGFRGLLFATAAFFALAFGAGGAVRSLLVLGPGAPTTFPVTLALAGAVFTAMLHLTLTLTAAVAVALDRGLAAYAGTVAWVRATPDDWVTTAALSFAGAGIILHVGIGLRWPFTSPERSVSSPLAQ